jgi:hypothetical protein
MSDPDFSQRVVLGAILEAHPRMLQLNDLTAQLAEVARVDEAVRILDADGLVRRLGDLIGATRAAVRFEQLTGGQ